MSLHLGFLVAGFLVFCSTAAVSIFRIARRARIDDLSRGKGSPLSGVLYSMTGGMSPSKKESARLHLPTYAAGIAYHLGTFLSFLWLFLHVFRIPAPSVAVRASTAMLSLGCVCGLGILVKRIVTPRLRHLSTPDDYFSNLVVTGFQGMSAVALWRPDWLPFLSIYAGLLFAYIPAGKLRHVIYFLSTRFYLGLFYGKRGVWPPSRRDAWTTRNP